jgi:hypothetical protein
MFWRTNLYLAVILSDQESAVILSDRRPPSRTTEVESLP